ncbi:hypothetical protein WN55_00936 [Dufourea novaeangliae]|uniref:Uncharacterized protein n=1 Tax=Dufourea novaeangliae TaxID=178035 RepID=A0A154PDC2_DUFNO|nr:hypothetical protein WN55_00936 [Dufourea novaeangliae]
MGLNIYINISRIKQDQSSIKNIKERPTSCRSIPQSSSDFKEKNEEIVAVGFERGKETKEKDVMGSPTVIISIESYHRGRSRRQTNSARIRSR